VRLASINGSESHYRAFRQRSAKSTLFNPAPHKKELSEKSRPFDQAPARGLHHSRKDFMPSSSNPFLLHRKHERRTGAEADDVGEAGVSV